MATVNVSLSPQMLAFVDVLVKTGRYASASEVVQDSLRLLEQERDVEIEKRDILKREVEAGLADAQAERFSSRTAIDIARDTIQASGRASYAHSAGRRRHHTSPAGDAPRVRSAPSANLR